MHPDAPSTQLASDWNAVIEDVRDRDRPQMEQANPHRQRTEAEPFDGLTRCSSFHHRAGSVGRGPIDHARVVTSETGPTQRCPTCGPPLDEHDRHVRFRLPDPVLAVVGWEGLPDTWLSDPDPGKAVMMHVPDLGGFVRCLLPVQLTGGYEVTFGLWLAVHPADLRRAFDAWWAPQYDELVLDGYLANALPSWGLLGAPASAEVRDVEATPYIVGSVEPQLARVLTEAWPHDDVLAALP